MSTQNQGNPGRALQPPVRLLLREGPQGAPGRAGGPSVAAFSRGTRRAQGEACVPVLLCIPAALRCSVSPLLHAQSWFYI